MKKIKFHKINLASKNTKRVSEFENMNLATVRGCEKNYTKFCGYAKKIGESSYMWKKRHLKTKLPQDES